MRRFGLVTVLASVIAMVSFGFSGVAAAERGVHRFEVSPTGRRWRRPA